MEVDKLSDFTVSERVWSGSLIMIYDFRCGGHSLETHRCTV